GMAELLSLEPLLDDQFKQVEVILESAHNLLDLINDILDFSKIEAGKMSLEWQDFGILHELEVWVSTFQAQNSNPDVSITWSPNNLPEMVKGDSTRLRQVLFNLIGNALKFTKKGTIDVSGHAQESEDGVRLFFNVRDSGIGILEEKIKQLFDPFNQLDSSVTRRYGGTGLGLAICAKLTAAMGGSISCESVPGEGSTFRFDVLFKPSEEPSRTKTEEVMPIQISEIGNVEILLVEDTPVNQTLCVRMIKKLGLTTDVASNGLEALESVKKKQYDLILMDLIMPEMGGLEASEKIRSLSLSKQPRIIALTANAFKEDRDRALAAGMDGFISKPFRFKDLREELINQLREQSEKD
ncbi:MAG: ATP-binding protein, partial [Verrucomicrobiota bacterium]